MKFLPDELGRDPLALERFKREARAASVREHPDICPIYEFGEQEGQPFIVMPLLEGQTLRERIAAGVALPVDQTLASTPLMASARTAFATCPLIAAGVLASTISFCRVVTAAPVVCCNRAMAWPTTAHRAFRNAVANS